jgi:hypothetical protein
LKAKAAGEVLERSEGGKQRALIVHLVGLEPAEARHEIENRPSTSIG